MTSIDNRFNAAVNVIKGLPKNGSYQPSNTMMLRFYAYYKQATIGPCQQNKPSFWDVVGKAKWDAWMALGDMPRERAMLNYVEELKTIIETMAYTDNVANFIGSVSELDGVSLDDLEAVAPETIKKVRSQPNSPFASREASPVRSTVLTNGTNKNETNVNGHLSNGSTIDQSDDEYIDTVEDEIEIPNLRKSRSHNYILRHDNNLEIVKSNSNEQILQSIQTIVQKMKNDVQIINEKMNSLEKQIFELKNIQKKQVIHRKNPTWWPFDEISPFWFSVLILWPFLIQRLTQRRSRN